MPSNPTPNLPQSKLRLLAKYLDEYARHIHGEQPLAAQVIATVSTWVKDDIDPNYAPLKAQTGEG